MVLAVLKKELVLLLAIRPVFSTLGHSQPHPLKRHTHSACLPLPLRWKTDGTCSRAWEKQGCCTQTGDGGRINSNPGLLRLLPEYDAFRLAGWV